MRLQDANRSALSATIVSAISSKTRTRLSEIWYTIDRPCRRLPTYPHHFRHARWLLTPLWLTPSCVTSSPTPRGPPSKIRTIFKRVASARPCHNFECTFSTGLDRAACSIEKDGLIDK